jgi:hypothetical protein
MFSGEWQPFNNAAKSPAEVTPGTGWQISRHCFHSRKLLKERKNAIEIDRIVSTTISREV